MEKEDALTDRDTGAALERIFGVRTVAPSSSIQKLFNDIGRPQWQTEMRVGNPEAQNIVNEYVFPYLEIRATRIAEEGSWDELSLNEKKERLNKLLKEGKKDVRAMMKGQTIGSDLKKAELIYQVTGQRSKGARVYRETLEDFGVTDETLDELDEAELEVLLWFIKDNASQNKESIEEYINPNE